MKNTFVTRGHGRFSIFRRESVIWWYSLEYPLTDSLVDTIPFFFVPSVLTFDTLKRFSGIFLRQTTCWTKIKKNSRSSTKVNTASRVSLTALSIDGWRETKRHHRLRCYWSAASQSHAVQSSWQFASGTDPEVMNGSPTIKIATRKDGGIYICKAENIRGLATDTALVVIFSPLWFKVQER